MYSELISLLITISRFTSLGSYKEYLLHGQNGDLQLG